jgi:hypothetical protein
MKTDFNFIYSYKVTNKAHAIKSNIPYWITVIIIALVVLISVLTVVIIGFNMKDSNYIAQLTVENVQLTEKSKAVTAANKELSDMTKKVKSVSEVQKVISEYRMLTKDDIDKIYGDLNPDVKIEQATYNASLFALDCTASSKESPSECAARLDKEGITAIVSYNGFKSSSKDAEGKKSEEVSFTIACMIQK